MLQMVSHAADCNVKQNKTGSRRNETFDRNHPKTEPRCLGCRTTQRETVSGLGIQAVSFQDFWLGRGRGRCRMGCAAVIGVTVMIHAMFRLILRGLSLQLVQVGVGR